MNSLSSTDGWYDGRPVASASIPLNLRSARSSSPTNTSITRTGLSSQIQSSRHSGNSVLWWRSVPSTKRFIRFLRKLRRNHNPRITSLSVFLHNQDPKATFSARVDGDGNLGIRDRIAKTDANMRLKPLVPMLQTDEMERTIEWYEYLLGFRCGSAEGDNWCRLTRDDITIMFMRNDHLGVPHATATQY